MATSTTRLSYRQQVIKRLYSPRHPIVSVTTSGGTTTTLEDSQLQTYTLPEELARTWIYMVEAGSGGPAYGESARGWGVSGDTISFLPAMTGTVDTDLSYELHPWFHPEFVNDKLDELLQRVEFTIPLPLSLARNPNFETWTSASAATGWTAASATLAQESTIVRNGRYAAKITATADGGAISSDTVFVSPGDVVFLYAQVYCTSGDSAYLSLYDADGTAILDTARTDQSGWSELCLSYTIPAGCEGVKIVVGGVSNTDIVYFDHAGIHRVGDEEIATPLEAEWSFDVHESFTYSIGKSLAPASTTDRAYAVSQKKPRFFSHFEVLRDETAVIPYKIQLENPFALRPVWLNVDVDYPAFAGASATAKDADTTKAPMDIMVPLAVVTLLRERAQEFAFEGMDGKAAALEARATRIMSEEIEPRLKKYMKLRAVVKGAL